MIGIQKNKKGFALVLALVMLALLSILGAYALSTSATELFIAGNYRNNLTAFTTADAGGEFGLRAVMTSAPATTSSVNYTRTIGNGTANITVTSVISGPMCPGRSESSTESGGGGFTAGEYYVVHSIGTGPASAQAVVESMACKPAMESS